jgi:PPOX class probable F420-dependent enzyme
MTDLSALQQFEKQQYLNLETFRKNGDGVKTPIWFVQAGEKLYVRTGGESGKVKRIHNHP